MVIFRNKWRHHDIATIILDNLPVSQIPAFIRHITI